MSEANESRPWGARARAVTWTLTAVTAILGLALLTQLNVIGLRHFGRWDMTDEKELALSDDTQKAVRALRREIGIYIVGNLSPMQGDESIFHAYDMALAMLNEYRSYSDSDKIKVHEVLADPYRDDLIQTLRSSFKGIQENMIYLITYTTKTEDGTPVDPKLKEIPLREVYRGDPTTGKVLEFGLESALTGALIELGGDEKKVVYCTTSHGEVNRMPQRSAMPAFAGAANHLGIRLNLEFRDLPAFAVVPADCDILMIPNPAGGFSREEAEAIDEYLQRGGRLYVSATYTSPLTEMLLKHGVEINSDYLSNGSPNYTVNCAFSGNHPISRHQATSGKGMTMSLVSSARRVQAPMSVNVTDLVVANEDVERIDRETRDRTGRERRLSDQKERPSVVVAAEQKEAAPGARRFRIVAMGFPFYQDIVMGQDPDIQQFTLNSFKWLLEREEQIALPPKKSARTPLKMTDEELQRLDWSMRWGYPCIGVALGLLAWGLRRK